MPRKAQNLNSMARGRVRASMNKYNLFNLYKKGQTSWFGKSIYQQKWKAKQETRSYHGEHLTERRWKQIFDPNLESVAQLDASLKGIKAEETPLPLQTYASLEKRLETALFRSLFASSVRQAREFILGGHVQVNGVTIKHPAFPLKSGDIFNVKPEKVLLAMGKNKPSLENSIKIDNKQIAVWNKYVKSARENPKDVWDLKQSKPETLNTIDKFNTESIKQYNKSLEKKMLQHQKETTRESVLANILKYGSKQEGEITPETFNELYGFGNSYRCFTVFNNLKKANHKLITDHSLQDTTKYIATKSNDFENEAAAKLASSVRKPLSELVSKQLEYLRVSAQNNQLPEDIEKLPYTSSFVKNLKGHKKLEKDEILEDESKARVSLPWQRSLFGRQDPTKPYFTPWVPRPFIGAFAILPAHIEISFSTCHAVYMRDPVARPGFSEVISPFPTPVHERAYMYYARKGL